MSVVLCVNLIDRRRSRRNTAGAGLPLVCYNCDGAGWLSTEPMQRGGMVGGHGALPWGPTQNNGIRPPVDEGLGATSGGLEDDVKLRDGVVPRLRPEQQIRQEEEVQTPPRREPRRKEGHQPRGPRAMTDESVLGPGDLAGQRKDIAGRNRLNNEWSPVAALEDTVSRMQ